VHAWSPYHEPAAGVKEGITSVLDDCTVARLEVDAIMEVFLLVVEVDVVESTEDTVEVDTIGDISTLDVAV